MLEKRLDNDASTILGALLPYKKQIEGVVVESTYNCYWLVDQLQVAGYVVHLANTTAIKQYDGLKRTDDRSDANWLAHLLELGILPTGYIYPKEQRGIRELLRTRLRLVQQQTRCVLSLQSIITRYQGIHISGDKLKALSRELLIRYLCDSNVSAAPYSGTNIYYRQYYRDYTRSD